MPDKDKNKLKPSTNPEADKSDPRFKEDQYEKESDDRRPGRRGEQAGAEDDRPLTRGERR